MAYTMVAERDDHKIKKERTSALIVLANARVWESQGWQVMITDAEGKEFDPAGFEKLLGPGYSWSPQEPLVSLSPQDIAPYEEQEMMMESFEEADSLEEMDSSESEELELDELELSDEEAMEHEPADYDEEAEYDEESAESSEDWEAA